MSSPPSCYALLESLLQGKLSNFLLRAVLGTFDRVAFLPPAALDASDLEVLRRRVEQVARGYLGPHGEAVVLHFEDALRAAGHQLPPRPSRLPDTARAHIPARFLSLDPPSPPSDWRALRQLF